jgi:hypothetical protein
MMIPEDKAETIHESFSVLVGLKLVRSQSFFATRHFYFGQDVDPSAALYTLGVECSWRIRRGDTIIVGSEDYSERGDDNTDESWNVDMPIGHLQDEQLVDLMGGELKAGSVINTGADLIVEFVEADKQGGFRLGLSEAYVLEVFPASVRQMEWVLSPPDGGGLILMNGVLNRSGKKNEGP